MLKSIIITLLFYISSLNIGLTQSLCEDPIFIEITDTCIYQHHHAIGEPIVSRWFKFTLDQNIEISTSAIVVSDDSDTDLELYYNDCDNMDLIAFDDNSGPFNNPEINMLLNPGIYYIQVIGSGKFKICVYGTALLPVKLLSYTIKESDYNTLLHRWVTGTETNNNYFKIYKSEDFRKWELIKQISGSINSSLPINYLTYTNSINKLTYFKLTQTDLNGKETIISILPYFNNKELHTLIKEISIDGKPIQKDYNGIKVKIYSDGTVEKVKIINHE